MFDLTARSAVVQNHSPAGHNMQNHSPAGNRTRIAAVLLRLCASYTLCIARV